MKLTVKNDGSFNFCIDKLRLGVYCNSEVQTTMYFGSNIFCIGHFDDGFYLHVRFKLGKISTNITT